jgi:hypothetical protein
MVRLVDEWVHDPAPAEEGLDEAELRAQDPEFQAAMEAIRFNEKVAARADFLRIDETARLRLRAEKVAGTNFDDHYLTRHQLGTLPAPDPLIKGVLPRHAYGILRGRDHSLKSFTALDWACCLATGKSWQDRDVTQTPVLYIAGEGAHGISSRVDAWEYAWGRTVDDNMLTTRRTALNLHQPGPAFDHLLDHIRARGYGLVIIDTLRRVSGAADGNGSEMGLVIDNLDLIKQATDNGTVLTVAHTDKGDHDTRGYSGIEDDADFVWAAKRDQEFLTLELTKMKDGPDGHQIHLIATRTLNSLTLSGTSGPGEINTTEHQTKILDALRLMMDDEVTGTALMSTAGFASGQKATFYRALKELVEAGHVAKLKHGRTTYYALPTLFNEPPADPGPEPTDPPDADPQLEG